jgi:hypothetical protein
MAKVLRGSSRQAWFFLRDNWQDLAKLSALPMLLLFASIFLQAFLIAGGYRDLAARAGNGTIREEFPQLLTLQKTSNLLVGLVTFLIFSWLFALIVRFTRTREAAWLARDSESIKAILMTILYGAGIFLLIFLVQLVTVTMIVLSFSMLFDFMQTRTLQGFPVYIAFVITFIPFWLQYWLLLRLLVGLPAVSFGNSPHFLRDFWRLAKGESWGLPLRMLPPGLLAFVIMAAIVYVAAWPVIGVLMGQSSGGSGEADAFLLLADATSWMTYYAGLLIIVFLPFFWFFTLLLTTAYHRFSQRQR